MASLTTGISVLLTLLLLAPLFSALPKPVLAAIIIEAVVMGMMNLPEMRRLLHVKRFDFAVAVAALLGHSCSACWPGSSSVWRCRSCGS